MEERAKASEAGYLGAPMVLTPWGDSGELRERRLAPGRGTPRGVARQNQRERLFAAMVAVTAEKSYAETSVADLVEASGVSSRSFYQHFSGKEECFAATLEEILGLVRAFTVAALAEGGQESVPSVERAVGGVVAIAATQAAAAKLCAVTAFSAGPGPRAQIAAALAEISGLLRGPLEEIPERGGMPAGLMRAMLGGVALTLYRRLATNRSAELPELGEALQAWVVSIPPPPAPLRAPARRRAMAPSSSPPFAAHVPAERLLRHFASVVAEKGYAQTTIAEVAARAQVSPNTFYRYFAGKEAALEAVLDSSGSQLLAAALPALRRQPQWPGAVRVGLEVMCGFLAAEPDFARLREVEIYAIGPEAVAKRDRMRAEIVLALAKVAEADSALGDFDPIAVEATLGALQALLYSRIAAGRLGDLVEVPPIATYMLLAPVTGAQAAWEVACG